MPVIYFSYYSIVINISQVLFSKLEVLFFEILKEYQNPLDFASTRVLNRIQNENNNTTFLKAY